MIELRLLGTLHLADAAGRELKSLLTRPRRFALLAYLAAATPRGFHRRDTLLGLFWPELDQEHARAALRQALHVLRGALSADAVVTRGDEEIGLDGTRVWCDVRAFDDSMASGQFDTALELYRGNLLEGFFIPGAAQFERWQADERARLQQAAARAAQTLVTRSENDGDFSTAMGWARHALRLGPHGEESLRALLALLDHAGDRASAVAAYDEFAKRLRADFDAEPAAETKALLAAIRARESAVPVELAARTGGRAPTAAARVQRPGRTAWLTLIAAALGVLLLATNVGGVRGRLWPRPRRGRITSLAVLPLANVSGDTLQLWYAQGLTQALITDLGRIGELPVILVDSVFPFRNTSKPLREVVRDLHVDALVEGGVQQANGMVRVEVRLIDPSSGYQLWADRFEEPLQNRFALEDRVARGIASALQRPTRVADRRSPTRTPLTRNLRAYDLYLRGKIRVRHETRQDDSTAIGLLERAVAVDPTFAAAFAELAHAYGLWATQFAPADLEARDRAAVAAEKALRLDPDLPEGHYARAFLLWGPGRQFPHELVIQEDRRALALDSTLADAHHHLGMVYLHIGLLDAAIAELRRALALDPSLGFAQQRIGIALVNQGRYEDGLRTFRQVPPAFNPSLWHYQVSWALLYLGRDAEASALIDRYLHDRPDDPGGVVTAAQAVLFAKRGDARRAEADIRVAIAKGAGFQHFHHAAYSIAMAYALMHRPAAAVRFLRQAAAEGLPCYPCFANDPFLAKIRDHPQFIAFMRDLKRQWERYQAILAGPAPTAGSASTSRPP